MVLEYHEYLTKMKVNYGRCINKITLYTNLDNKINSSDATGFLCTYFAVPDTSKIISFYGSFDHELLNIGIITIEPDFLMQVNEL